MKKLQVLGLGLIVAIGLSGCIEKKEDKEKEESIKVWKQIKKEIEQIKKERKDNNQTSNDSQKKLDDWYEKKSAEGKKSSMLKSLDINNN